MLWLYRLLFLPVLLVIAPRYLLRMRRRGGYAENFAHRFGRHPALRPKPPGRRRVWLQAVSVGEMLAVGPILEALHRAGHEIYLTTTTSTGYKLAAERYPHLVLGLGYFPLDWWLFSACAWEQIQPDLIVLTEGERWPEHLWQATRRGVPVICVNARLSDRSFARLRRFSSLAHLMLGGVTKYLAASALDEARFAELGVPRDRLLTTGNIKLDVRIPRLGTAEQRQLRHELGLPEEPVLLGSSTWPGEESALIAALRHTRLQGQPCRLLLVPRHAERRVEIEKLLAATDLRYHFRSRGPASQEVDVAVADTTGELRRLTQIADLVFVGKSLPPHTEGQTPVEAAALQKPIVFGPGMGNFRVIARELLQCGAAAEVPDGSALPAIVAELLGNESRRETLAREAAAWHRANAGAIERTLDVLQDVLARQH